MKLLHWSTFLALFLSLLLAFGLFTQSILAGSKDSGGNPGEWYIGAVPPNLNPDHPVLLFVHGLNSSAKTWHVNNDMYATAYDYGYQTAFVDLYPDKNMWNNGQLLAQRIQEVYHYFGKQIVIVTHSKGGIDAQSALTHYEAYPYVSNVITLGSPHYGSQLADLAYSSSAWWLSTILGQRNEATYSLQTSYMSYFRSVTDSHENASRNGYYTLAGTSWGSFASALWWGGLYLSNYGFNDGAVVVNEAYSPNGEMIRIDSWNHDQIRTGRTFEYFETYLTSFTLNTTPQKQHPQAGSITAPKVHSGSHYYLQGGEHQGTLIQPLTIENGVNKATISLLSDKQADQIFIRDPNGNPVSVQLKVSEDHAFFDGAWTHVLELNQPMAGNWTVEGIYQQGVDGAFLLYAQYDSTRIQDIAVKGNTTSKTIEFSEPAALASNNVLKAIHSIDFIPEKNNEGMQQVHKLRDRIPVQNTHISLPAVREAGVYNVTIEFAGKTPEGYPFKRTIVKTMYQHQGGQLFE